MSAAALLMYRFSSDVSRLRKPKILNPDNHLRRLLDVGGCSTTSRSGAGEGNRFTHPTDW